MSRKNRSPERKQDRLSRRAAPLVIVFVLTAVACSRQPVSGEGGKTSQDFDQQRRNLVNVLRSQGITSNTVLKSIGKVPRHEFVPPPYRHLAYQNQPLPIGHEQTISQPFIVAYMTEAASIAPGEKVLEIGTGSGYQAAVLAELAGEVYSIEIIPELADGARSVLANLGYKNVHVKTGNGYLGWPEQAPFDAIVVTAAPDEVPRALVEQLAFRGRMVVPVGTSFQQMVIISKDESGLVERRTIPVRFVPMTGKP